MKAQASIISILVSLLTLTSCSDIDNIRNFANCEFELYDIVDPLVANVSFANVRSVDDLSRADWLSIQAAYRDGSLPLSVTVKMKATNNGDGPARLQRLLWRLSLQQQQLVTGEVSNPVNIPAGESVVVPFYVHLNIVDLVENGTFNEMLNLVRTILGAGDSTSTVAIGVKPTIVLAGREFTPNQFITIVREFGGS